MPEYEQQKCRGCQAPIRFIKIGWDSEKSKAKYAVVEEKPLGAHTQKIGGVWQQTFIWQDHHGNCPNAQDFRKPKEAPEEQYGF